MSTIFISHSSQDRRQAHEVSEQLRGWKYESLFLDFDPVDGIPAGHDWHREIYRALRSSQAVIFLCSPASLESHWCFAELAGARSASKHLFPLRVGPLPTPEALKDPAKQTMQILESVQMIDLTADPGAGYEQLQRGLKLAGLEDGLPWDRERPPYPGMMSFTEEDAGVYFGREHDIDDLLDRIGGMQVRREPLLLVVFGGSGCGKSSLVRAGIIPRLRRDQARWLLVPPFRPRQQPRDELARALAEAFAAAGDAATDWKRIRDAIDDVVSERAAAALVELANDLRMRAGRREASVLLVIDQLEELFAESVEEEAGKFLTLLRAALGANDSPLLAVATMRSEFFTPLQARPELNGFSFEPYSLGPMDPAGFRSVITGPADCKGIDIEPGLVEQMIDDMKNEDALPLLAFTLRQLYDRGGADGRFTKRDYAELGGVKGAVKKCVEDVLAGSQATLARSEGALRVAFLDHLGTLSEDGQLTRHTASWSDIPEAAHPILGRFCEARLLISSTENSVAVVEVAHEALFRVWSTLAQWIDADREFLFWRKRFRAALVDWKTANHDRALLLRGALLSQARRRLHARPDRFTEPEKSFIRASRHQRWMKVAAAAGVALVFGTALYEFYHIPTKVGALIDRVEALRAADPPGSVALAAQIVQTFEDNNRAWTALRESLLQAHARAILPLPSTRPEAPENVTVIAFAPDGTHAVAAGSAETARVWRLQDEGVGAEQVAELPVAPAVQSASFSANGQRLVIGDTRAVNVWDLAVSQARLIDSRPASMADVCQGAKVAVSDAQGVHIWSVVEDTYRALSGSPQHVNHLLFSPDCSRLAVAGDGGLRLWDVHSEAPVPLHGNGVGGLISRLRFSPDGRSLLAVRLKEDHSEVLRWDTASGAAAKPLSGSGTITDAALSPDGTRVAAVSTDRWFYIWDAATGQRIPDAGDTLGNPLLSVMFSPGGTWIATAGEDHTVGLWLVSSGKQVGRLRGHQQAVGSATFSPDGRFILSGGRDGHARLWSMETDGRRLRSLPHQVSAQAVSPLGGETLIATGDLYGLVRLWSLDGPPVELFKHGARVRQLAFSANGAFLVSASEDGTARVWQRKDDPAQDESWQALGKPLPHNAGANVQSAALNSTGTVVVTAPDNEAPRLWTRAADGTWQSLSLESTAARLVALSPDDRWVAVATDSEVLLGPPKVGAALQPLLGPATRVNAVSFSPDSASMVTANNDGKARIWDVATRTERINLPHQGAVVDAAFNPDGSLIVTAVGHDVWVWNPESGEGEVLLNETADVKATAVDGRGRYLIASTGDHRVTIYQWAAFAPKEALLGEIKRIRIDVPQMNPLDWLL